MIYVVSRRSAGRDKEETISADASYCGSEQLPVVSVVLFNPPHLKN